MAIKIKEVFIKAYNSIKKVRDTILYYNKLIKLFK